MTLKRLIDAQGFPPGVLITPNARAWDEAGVAMLRGLAFKADCDLTKPAGKEGDISDPDARILQAMKANYAPLADEIRMRWAEGRVVNETAGPVSRLAKATIEATAEAVFLDLPQQFEMEGRDVSVNPSRSYAPTQFADHADAPGVGKRALEGAMNHLLKGSLPGRRFRDLVEDPATELGGVDVLGRADGRSAVQNQRGRAAGVSRSSRVSRAF